MVAWLTPPLELQPDVDPSTSPITRPATARRRRSRRIGVPSTARARAGRFQPRLPGPRVIRHQGPEAWSAVAEQELELIAVGAAQLQLGAILEHQHVLALG